MRVIPCIHCIERAWFLLEESPTYLHISTMYTPIIYTCQGIYRTEYYLILHRNFVYPPQCIVIDLHFYRCIQTPCWDRIVKMIFMQQTELPYTLSIFLCPFFRVGQLRSWTFPSIFTLPFITPNILFLLYYVKQLVSPLIT